MGLLIDGTCSGTIENIANSIGLGKNCSRTVVIQRLCNEHRCRRLSNNNIVKKMHI